jgi:hypothetical protein
LFYAWATLAAVLRGLSLAIALFLLLSAALSAQPTQRRVFVSVADVLVSGSTAATSCEALGLLKLPHVTVSSAVIVPPGALALRNDQLPRADSSYFTAFNKLPAFCRIQAVSAPSPASHIEFEVWLPAAGWNGRYVGAGNGGAGGRINYYRIVEAVNAGYAGSSTDTGHRTSIDSKDAAIDFDHRAIHETAVNAKQIIRAFYGENARHSYFQSCSTGGRQALIEAQLYPSDYDGISAGAPAFDFEIAREVVSAHKLKAFKDRGGKLMLYHGERDSPGPSIAYYQRLLQTFGQKGIEEFVRFYLVPDMGHCGGGPVPEFGTRLWPAVEDADHSMILALERWVERGVGPKAIIATKYRIDEDWTSGVERTRPLCPYPLRATWSGTGSSDSAASYVCIRRTPK